MGRGQQERLQEAVHGSAGALARRTHARARAAPQIEMVDIRELGEEKGVWPSKAATLIDIHMELLAPYGEVRPRSAPLSEKDVFLLQVGRVRVCACAEQGASRWAHSALPSLPPPQRPWVWLCAA